MKRLLDLFCKAGGCTKGYQLAGFEVVGVDIEPQQHYCGSAFIQGDAVEVMRVLLMGGSVTDSSGRKWRLSDFDGIHASPPCQEYSVLASLKTKDYAMFIDPIRCLLIASGLPYVIENVPGAPLINPLVLCGTMFGLRVIRHRHFETSFNIQFAPYSCNHWGRTQPRNDKRGESKIASLERHAFLTVTGHDFRNSDASRAMKIDWMTNAELAEAIPPAYTEFIGRQMLALL